MNTAEIVILVLLAAGVVAAMRHALRHGACGECGACGTCKACAGSRKSGCAAFRARHAGVCSGGGLPSKSRSVGMPREASRS